ncbi:MAG TPA: cupredoxin domain-containing protein [Rhodoblastus sp.]|nr:cupredoxin domain-containing protein [Rhodoblastus sp.]
MKPCSILAAATLGGALIAAAPVRAEDGPTITLTVKDHRFDQTQPKAVANKPFTIVVKNLDQTAIEFESKTLRVEKVIVGGAEASFKIRALPPGRYKFEDEFHDKTAKGELVAE